MSSIRWVTSQVNRLKRAVANFNRTITWLEKKYDGMVELPNRVNFNEEKANITSGTDLNRRVKQLNRILVKNNPNAQSVVDGKLNYLKREIQYAKRYNDKKRRELRKSLYPEWDNMSKVEQATALANKNISDLIGEYTSAQDLTYLWNLQYHGRNAKVSNYIEQWEKYNGDSSVVNAILKIQSYDANLLDELFEGPWDEVDIEYIYPSTTVYRGENVILRHYKIIEFWNEQLQALENIR